MQITINKEIEIQGVDIVVSVSGVQVVYPDTWKQADVREARSQTDTRGRAMEIENGGPEQVD